MVKNRKTQKHRLADGRLLVMQREPVGRKWHVWVTGYDLGDPGEYSGGLSKAEALDVFTGFIRADVCETI